MSSPPTSTRSETPAARALGRFGWVSFEWAVIPCFTLVNTYIFAPYFSAQIVADPIRGQALWGYLQAAAGLLIAIAAPPLGAIADALGPRKPWMLAFSILAAAGLTLLWSVVPGDPAAVAISMSAVVLMSISIEYMVVFHNAMLPSLVPENALGRWSGLSFAVGFIGSIAALLLVRTMLSGSSGLVADLDLAAIERERLLGPVLAVWMGVFVAPLFWFTPDVLRRPTSHRAAIKSGCAQLVTMVRQSRHYRNIWIYFAARMIFYDGLLALFMFTGVFASGLFGWKSGELASLGIVQFTFGALGAGLGGRVDDRIGSKRTLIASLLVIIAATGAMLLIAPEHTGGADVLTDRAAEPQGQPFSTPAERVYLLLSSISALFIGPTLASSRTMVARLAPHALMTQFYGVFSVLGRATSFLAPLAIGIVTTVTQSQRAGLSVVVIFMAVGLAVLSLVREQRTVQ